MTRAAAALLIGAGCLHAVSAGSTEPTERAARILDRLAGEWSFELGATSGVRTIEVLYPGLVVNWSEEFDGRDVAGAGFIGWDPHRRRFFSLTVHNVPGEYDLMIGRLSTTEDVIEFEPPIADAGTSERRSIFHMLGDNRFSFTALERRAGDEWREAWVAVFERRRSSQPPS